MREIERQPQTWLSGHDLLRGEQEGCRIFGHQFEGPFRQALDWDSPLESRACQRPVCDISEVRWRQ